MTTGSGPLFIAPGEKPVPTPLQAPVVNNLGPCRWLVDTDKNIECLAPGEHKVRVDGREVPANIIVCTKHKAVMNDRYAARRAARRVS